MKKLSAFLLAIALTFSAVSAQVLFNPDLTTGSTPSTYNQASSNGGTISFAGNQMTVGDLSVNGAQAYIQSTTNPTPNSTTLDTQFTFTPTFNVSTANASDRTAADTNILNFTTTGGNNRLFNVDFVISGYNNNDQIIVGSGFQYGGGTPSGSNSISSGGINSLAGHTLMFTDVETLDNSGFDSSTGAGYVINNSGSVFDVTAGASLGTFNYTVTSRATDNVAGITDIVNNGFDPINNPLTLSAGLPPSGAGNGQDGFIDPGATIAFSSINIADAVPEPSTWAMLLGGLGSLVYFQRRAPRA